MIRTILAAAVALAVFAAVPASACPNCHNCDKMAAADKKDEKKCACGAQTAKDCKCGAKCDCHKKAEEKTEKKT